MDNGWIKIHRKLLKWEWFDEPNTFRLFIYLLLKANHKPKSYRGITIETGQLMTGLNVLSKETGLSVRSIRTCLKRLKSTNEVTIKTSTQGTIIQVVKYNDYQIATNKKTNERQTNDKRTTTNKNDNNIKNENKYNSEREFLQDWNDLRKRVFNKPSHLNRIGNFEDKNNFVDLCKDYNKEDFVNAMTGLFKQKKMPNDNTTMQSNPSHFLKYFNSYLTAYHDKNVMLYGKNQE